MLPVRLGACHVTPRPPGTRGASTQRGLIGLRGVALRRHRASGPCRCSLAQSDRIPDAVMNWTGPATCSPVVMVAHDEVPLIDEDFPRDFNGTPPARR